MPRSQRMAAEIPICAQTTIKVVQNSTYKWVNNLFVRVRGDIYMCRSQKVTTKY